MYLVVIEDCEIRMVRIAEDVKEQTIALAKEIKGEIHIVSTAKILEIIKGYLHDTSGPEGCPGKKYVDYARKLMDGLDINAITEGR